MGRVASSLIKRPWMNYNVENRAQKVMQNKDKPDVAPRHPSTTEILDKFSKDHPEILEEQSKKNENLTNMLKGLVVEPEKMAEITASRKHLPEDRSKVVDAEFGYLEPESIRPGHCSIKQAMEFLGQHYTDPETNNAALIAKEYKLDPDKVRQILKHFRVFLVKIPGMKMEASSNQSTSSYAGKLPSFSNKQIASSENKIEEKPIEHSSSLPTNTIPNVNDTKKTY